jgi:hypothetical protein
VKSPPFSSQVPAAVHIPEQSQGGCCDCQRLPSWISTCLKGKFTGTFKEIANQLEPKREKGFKDGVNPNKKLKALRVALRTVLISPGEKTILKELQ